MLNPAAIQDFKKRLRGQLLTIDIDPKRQIARAQTGLKLGEFDREPQNHRLVMRPPPLSWWLSLLSQINYVSRLTNIWEYLMSLPRIPQLDLVQKMTKPHKMDLQRLVGRRIRVARKNAGLFQRELAERVGVSRNQITSVELGVSDTGFTVIIDIARAVGVKTRQLLP